MSELKLQLRTLLDRVHPKDIWRPIFDVDGSLIVDGHEDLRDCSPDDLGRVDFSGKHVLDLGCNYGYYSFLVKRLGAESVLGIDIDADAVQGCRLLSRLYGFTNMEFMASDFINLTLNKRFDCTLLVNFIGKRSLCKGIVPLLETVRALSRDEIILSVRFEYNIPRNLQVLPEQLAGLYGAEYVRGESFYLVEFLRDFFSDRWQMSVISPEYADRTLKRVLLFTPLSSSGT